MRVKKAADACGSVGNKGELRRALRDQKHKGNTTGLSGGKFSLILSKVPSVDTSTI